MINNPLLEKLFLHYAAGTLSRSELLMVASLLALNEGARMKVAAFENLGGALIQAETPVALSTACLEAVLKKIDAAPCTAAICIEKEQKALLAPGLEIPREIYALFCDYCGDDAVCWSVIMSGVSKLEMPKCRKDASGKILRLLHLAPHQSTPAHAHQGPEITLILSGGYVDAGGVYRRGDIIVIEDPAFVHAPKADAEGCLCMVLTEAPVRFRTPFNRVLNLFMRF